MTKWMLFTAAVSFAIIAGCSENNAPVAPDAKPIPKNEAVPGLMQVTQTEVVPGQYIVLFSSKAPDVRKTGAEERLTQLDSKISVLKRAHNFTVLYKYETVFSGFTAQMDEKVAEALSHNPNVERIEPDGIAYTCAQTVPWGIAAIATRGITGSSSITDVDVYVIDTGVQTNHPDLNVVGGRNYAGGKSTAYTDGNGHGTHVAGTIAARDNTSYVVGVCPGAPIYAVRVLNNQGSGTFSAIISGVNWAASKVATTHRKSVANMSLGGYAGTTSYNSLDVAVRNAVTDPDVPLTICIAAGNNSGADASMYTPAHVSEAITVAAYGSINNNPNGPFSLASFSNIGSIVDIAAPGVSILSTYKGSTTATMSGTSMATPHVAGTAARYLHLKGNASCATVQTNLVNDAQTSGIPPITWSGGSYYSVWAGTY